MLMPFRVGDTVTFITEGVQKFTVTDFIIKPEFDASPYFAQHGGNAPNPITVETHNVSMVTYISPTPEECNRRPATPSIVMWCVDARALRLVKRFDVLDMNINDEGVYNG